MAATVPRLLRHAFDFAGMFPPGCMSLDDALNAYFAYRLQAEAAILNRFCCPVADLRRLLPMLRTAAPSETVKVAAIGRRENNPDSWIRARTEEAALLNDFWELSEGLAIIESYELSVPDDMDFEWRLDGLGGFDAADVFVEFGWDGNLSDCLVAIAETEDVSAKARMVDLPTGCSPRPYQVAAFISDCAALELPFKMTAGLHHAVTSQSAGQQTYGFVNVLAATALALSDDLSPREIENILTSSHVMLEGNDVAVNGQRINSNTAEAARELFQGIGSCSIDEPWADILAYATDGNREASHKVQ